MVMNPGGFVQGNGVVIELKLLKNGKYLEKVGC